MVFRITHIVIIFRYKCINKKDGIAVKKDDNGTMEGSDSRDKSYKCNGEGEYTLPIDALSGLPEFPSCIPRRMNCFLRYYTLHDVYLHAYITYFFYS